MRIKTNTLEETAAEIREKTGVDGSLGSKHPADVSQPEQVSDVDHQSH